MLSVNTLNFQGTTRQNNNASNNCISKAKTKNNDNAKNCLKLASAIAGLAILGLAAVKAPKVAKKIQDNNPLSDNNDKILNEIRKRIGEEFSSDDFKGCFVTLCSKDDYIAAIKQGHFKPKKFIAAGGESLVLELTDGNILKLSPIRYNYNVENVSAPELSRGKFVIKTNTNEEKTIFYQLQRKINVGGITQEELESIKQKAEEQGCILKDYMLDDGVIKQANFGWFLNDKQERIPCVLDAGVLKRTPERHFFEELIQAAEKETISENDFTAHMSNTLLIDNIMLNSKKSIDGLYKEYRAIVDEFINLANTGKKPLDALQFVLKKHNLPPIKEFNIN